MQSGCAAVRPQSGGISAALIAVAGFAAGALVVGLVALTRPAGPSAPQTARLPASSGASRDVVPPPLIDGGRAWPDQAGSVPWPFESAQRPPARAPGAKRPDRLSGPDGWTVDAAARKDQTE
jgi:hypothetical protein